MKKKTNKNPYFRQLKNGKLRPFTVLYLRYRGKKDGEKHIIHKNEKGEYTSPFITQETQLCIAAMKMEQELFVKKIAHAQTQIELAKLQGNEKEAQRIRNPAHNITEKIQCDFERSVVAVHSQEQKMIMSKKREKKILLLRCDQLYSILLAKLSVYWSGVMQKIDEQLTASPLFEMDNSYRNIDALFGDL